MTLPHYVPHRRTFADFANAVTLTLPYPPSVNEWKTPTMKRGRRSGVTYAAMIEAKPFRDYKREVRIIARQAHAPRIHGRVAVVYALYPARPLDADKRAKLSATWDDDVRCIDLDNAMKVVLDALKQLVFDDDARVHELHGYRVEPDGDRRLIVTIAPMLTVDLTTIEDR